MKRRDGHEITDKGAIEGWDMAGLPARSMRKAADVAILLLAPCWAQFALIEA